MQDAIRFPFTEAPAPGAATEVAPGILWLRLPLPMALDHVNLYALDDGDGWTLIDTGMNSRLSRDMMAALMAGPLGGKPVLRVIVTHHHPDHVGLAGWHQERGAELWATRTAWLYARMLVLDEQPMLQPAVAQMLKQAGTPPEVMARRETERPFNFSDVVHPMPVGFQRLQDGQLLTAGGRRWHVRFGQGHAPDHATLWALDEPLVIGGDQFLPGISPNIGVYATEPQADPLAEWLEACQMFQAHARDDQLILPGHKLPFYGLPFRLQQMADNHHQALDRLMANLAQPMRAVDTFATLYRREIGHAEFSLALAEALAHLNWLLQRGMVSRSLGADGAWIWQAR